MSTRPSLRRTFTAGTAALLLSLVSIPAFAQRPGAEEVSWRGDDAVTKRASGEIEVRSSTLLLSERGNPFAVTIAFENEDDYLASLDQGAKGIHLGRLEVLWYGEGEQKFVVRHNPGGKVALTLAEEAKGTLCGSAVLSGFTKLDNGVTVGVSLHSAKVGDFEHDIHGACDFFAAGGCGAGACYNSHETATGVILYKGDCRELEVWGPNTCYCHTTSIIHWS